MSEKKEFGLDDVLSVTTGRLVSDRHIEGVYDILNHVTQDDLFTHQLPRASEEATPWLHEQFPQLAGIETDPDGIPKLEQMLADAGDDNEQREAACAVWVR